MKRYRVYVSHGYVGCEDEYDIIEFDDDATEEEIDKKCSSVCGELLAGLDSGYYELEEGKDE